MINKTYPPRVAKSQSRSIYPGRFTRVSGVENGVYFDMWFFPLPVLGLQGARSEKL